MSRGNRGGRGRAQDQTKSTKPQEQKPFLNERERRVESADMKGTRPDQRRGRFPDYVHSRDNSPDWYVDNDALLRAVASYPFAHPLGLPYQTDDPVLDQYSAPGIMALYFEPTVGYADSAVSGINIAARRLFGFVRKANSGSTNYDYPDLMQYIIAMDSVHMFHNFLCRLYGVMYNYSKTNRYYPVNLVQAMGVSYDDLKDHIPDLRAYINLNAARLSSLVVPKSISYYARHQWMVDGYYIDSDTAKAQSYMYVPAAYYKWNEGTSTTAPGYCESKRFLPWYSADQFDATNLLTFENLTAFGDKLLNPIIGSQDFAIMGGDILKAYGEGNVMVAGTIDENYVVLPSYSKEVLSQFENATVYSAMTVNKVVENATLNAGYLVSRPELWIDTRLVGDVQPWLIGTSTAAGQAREALLNSFAVYSSNQLLNFHMQEVTPADVIVATRVMSTVDEGSLSVVNPSGTPFNGDTYVKASSHNIGSEVITDAGVFMNFTPTSTGVTQLMAFSIPSLLMVPIGLESDVDNLGGMRAVTLRMAALSTFDWHPKVYIAAALINRSANAVTSMAVMRPQGILADVDNYTFVDSRNLANMTKMALLNEFWVPAVN